MRLPLLISALAVIGLASSAVEAQISDDVVRIGVLNDQSSLYADAGGAGSVIAAKMAVEDAEQALALDPTEAVAHLNRGAGMVGLRRYQDAIAALDQAIALKIEPLQIAYFNRALAKEALGDVPGAYPDGG